MTREWAVRMNLEVQLLLPIRLTPFVAIAELFALMCKCGSRVAIGTTQRCCFRRRNFAE